MSSRKLEAGAYSLGPDKKHFDLGSISCQSSGFEEVNSQRMSLSFCISKRVEIIPTLEAYYED